MLRQVPTGSCQGVPTQTRATLAVKTSVPPQLFATQGRTENRRAVCQKPPAPGAAEGAEGEPEGARKQVRAPPRVNLGGFSTDQARQVSSKPGFAEP